MPKQKKNESSTTEQEQTKTSTTLEKRVEPALPQGVLSVLMTQTEVEGLVDLLRITAIVYDTSRQLAERQADMDAATVNGHRAELAKMFLHKFQAASDIGEPDSRYNH